MTIGIGSVGTATTLIVSAIAYARQLACLDREVQAKVEADWDGVWAERQREHLDALQQYETSRDEARDAHEQDEEYRVAAVQRLLDGDVEAMAEAIELELADQSFPFEALARVAVPAKHEAYVLVDLPEIDDVIPETRTTVLKSGEKREKKRSATERQELYGRLVCGLAYQAARIAFELAPTLREVYVAGYTQRRGRSGGIGDEFVLELVQTRAANAAFDYAGRDPVTALVDDGASRVKMTKTGKMSKIAAPRWAD